MKIKLCKNIHCELKETCYRYNKKPTKKQIYIYYLPNMENNKVTDCPHFIKIVKK